jgi:hypothetical protein
MLELLGTIFGSIFSGGATGLIGVVLQRFADYKNKQLDMKLEAQRAENEIAKRRVDAEIMAQEWAGRLKVAQEEGETAKDVAATNAFAQSLWKEPDRYSYAATLTPQQQWVMVILDALRGVVRPFLTVYLCALTTYVWFQVRQTLSAEDLSSDSALDVWKMVVGQILYLTTTVVLWWFGTRNRQDAPKIKL